MKSKRFPSLPTKQRIRSPEINKKDKMESYKIINTEKKTKTQTETKKTNSRGGIFNLIPTTSVIILNINGQRNRREYKQL